MKCMNCGLPLSPARTLSNCPRCGAALNMAQNVEQQPFDQAGWGGTGATPPPLPYNPWGQEVSPNPNMPFYQQGPQNQSQGFQGPQNQSQGFQGPQNQFGTMPGQISETPGSMRSGLPQSSLAPRRPFTPSPKKSGAGLKIALVGLILATLLLAGIAIVGFSGLGKSSPTTTNVTAPTANTQATAPSPTTASASPTANASATGTPYPAQQYIDGAQMVTGVDPITKQLLQPTTTFTVGTKMYVAFNLHPPVQGGAYCTYWYLNNNPTALTSFSNSVKPNQHASYTFATYTSPGPAYVEIYWASDKTCADKVLAQHVDFTVTN